MRKCSNSSIPRLCGDEGTPRWLSVELTYRCQNHCAWCYNPRCRKQRPELSAEVWSRIITEAADLGTEVVVFTGGEPLLVPFLEQLVDLASGLGLLPGLVTNGELLPNRAQGLLRSGLGLVWISLVGHNACVNDSITERSGSFQYKIQALRAVFEPTNKNDIVLMANVVVEPRNCHHVYAMLKLLADEGVHVAYVEEVVRAGGAKSKPWSFLNKDQRQVALAQLRRAQEEFSSLVSLTRTLDRPAGEQRPPPSDFLNVTPDGFLTQTESRMPEAGFNVAERPLAELLGIMGR